MISHVVDSRFKKSKMIHNGEPNGPKIKKRSFLGIATASSGKRQELDSELACPTPRIQSSLLQNIYSFLKTPFDHLQKFICRMYIRLAKNILI